MTLLRRRMRVWRWLLAAVLPLAAWIAVDFAFAGSHSLRVFDGHAVGRLETAMGRSYYGHKPLVLFGELVDLLRDQYRVPFWRACAGPHRVLIHQNYDSAIPFLRTEAFRDQQYGGVPVHVLKGHRRDAQEVGQVGGKAIQLWQFRLVIPRFRTAARERVSDWQFGWCQVAHQAQYAEPAAEVTAEV